MLKVGLTGGIATGKSTVKEIFKNLGAYVIDADEIVKELWKDKQIQKQAEEILGIKVLDEKGNLKVKEIASVIFKNKEKKKKLEKLFHPEVFKYIQKWFRQIEEKDKTAIAIAEVPLMIETGSYKNYDLVILVYAPKDMQIKRLLKKGYSLEEAQQRINSQMDIEEKRKYADIIIENTTNLENLKKQIEKVFKELKEKSIEKANN